MARALRFIAATLVGAMALLSLQPLAYAQGACDPVLDMTGSVDTQDIRQAAQPLEDRGATVVVRAYSSVPDGDLEAEVERLIQQCFSDGPEGIRANLILVAVSVSDRKTWIAPGEDWLELAPVERSIQLDEMNPKFADGEVTEGLVAGLTEIERVLAQTTGTPTSPVPTSSEDGGGLGPGLAAGGLAALGAAGGATLLFSRRRELSNARQALEDRAAEPRVRVGTSRERAHRLITHAEILEHTVSGRTLDRLRELRAEARAASTATERASALFVSAVPDGIASANKAQLAEGEARLTSLEETLERTKEALDRFDGFGDLVERLRVSLPAKQSLMEPEFVEAENLGRKRIAQGWKVEDELRRLEEARRQSQSLDFSGLSPDLLAMSEQLEAIEAELFATRHTMQSFPDRPAALKDWSQRLAESESSERQRIATVESEFSRVAAVHDSQSWRWASGHPESALSHLDKSNAIRTSALEGSVPAQEFELAGHQLEQAGLEIIAADALLDKVDTLMVNLETARLQAPGVLAEAEEELGELIEFVSANGRDLQRRFALEPREIDVALQGLRAELSRGRPNHLEVAQTALRIAHQIDALLIEAQEEKQRVVALRRALGREVARASREIERAQRSVGWELFKSRDGKDLEGLKNELASLSGPLEQQLVDAEDITADAVAIRERIIARRRRESTWVVVGGSGGWGGGSSRGGWGGSGSSGSGSSGGGGFGGGSFGGGGFGGGSFGGGGFGGGGFGGGGSGSSW